MTGRWPRLYQRVRSGVTAKTLASVKRPDAGTLASVKRPDAGSLCDRTLVGYVRSVLTYADVRRTEETSSDRTLAGSGQAWQKSVLEPYCKRPDARCSASGQLRRSVR